MIIPQRYSAKRIQIQVSFSSTAQSVINTVDSIRGLAGDGIEEIRVGINSVLTTTTTTAGRLDGNLVEFSKVGFKIEFTLLHFKISRREEEVTRW
jgi:hypothetical protein